MDTQTISAQKKSFDNADELREFPHGKLELVHLDEATLARVTLQPGWQWSTHVGPIANTGTCQVSHLQYVLGGRLLIAMDDGSKIEMKAGDAAFIPPGHDAWVVGDEPFVAVDLLGMKEYARESER